MKKLTINDLTVEQRAKLLIGKNFWHIEDFEGRLPIFMMSDGPVGLRHPRHATSGDQEIAPSIAYPSFEVLSQTWNLELAKKLGNAIANDCIDLDVDIILGPGVNIKRLPHNGRNFEYLSEDPLLAGVLAKEYIDGVQEKNVGACLKHYACNNSEVSRNFKSMDVSERALREIYLKPFEIATKAKPWTIMTAYNLVNGVRMSEHNKLYKILREEFCFDGLIISDWDAVMDRNKSLNAGLDIEMPFSKPHLDTFLADLHAGRVDVEKINESASRIIDFTYANLDHKALRKVDLTIDQRYEIAEQIAEQGIVLLKNDNNVLPLNKNKKILATGAGCHWYVFGGGSSEVTPLQPYIKLIDALKDEGLKPLEHQSIAFNRGANTCVTDLKGTLRKIINEEVETTILTITQDNHQHSEAYNRQDLKLSSEQVSAINEISKVSKKTVVVIYAGAPVEMKDWIDNVDAVLWVGYVGERGNKAIAKVLSGAVNPSGKTSETFPLSMEDVAAVNSYEDANVAVYQEDLNVGYRQFVTDGKPVQFPFGHGLSYSSFEYKDLKLTVRDGTVDVEFIITNTSNIDGFETAQIYVEELSPNTYRPRYELKAWKKVYIAANTSEIVKIKLDHQAFQYFSTAHDEWVINNDSDFAIMVGKSSANIVLQKSVRL